MRTAKFTTSIISLLLLFSISACQRPASHSPTGAITPTAGGVDFMVSTQISQALMDASAKATETAMASSISAQATGGETSENQSTGEEVQSSSETSADSGRPATYTLQPGEWPICIARRFDLDVANFLAINGLDLSSKPASGARLNIPQTGNWSNNYGPRALRGHPAEYTVKSGDTIYTIACQFGDVSPEAILSANQLAEPGDISAGQVLQIP